MIRPIRRSGPERSGDHGGQLGARIVANPSDEFKRRAAPSVINGTMRLNQDAALNLASVRHQPDWFKAEGLVGSRGHIAETALRRPEAAGRGRARGRSILLVGFVGDYLATIHQSVEGLGIIEKQSVIYHARVVVCQRR